jgi:hypothetical protein
MLCIKSAICKAFWATPYAPHCPWRDWVKSRIPVSEQKIGTEKPPQVYQGRHSVLYQAIVLVLHSEYNWFERHTRHRLPGDTSVVFPPAPVSDCRPRRDMNGMCVHLRYSAVRIGSVTVALRYKLRVQSIRLKSVRNIRKTLTNVRRVKPQKRPDLTSPVPAGNVGILHQMTPQTFPSTVPPPPPTPTPTPTKHK